MGPGLSEATANIASAALVTAWLIISAVILNNAAGLPGYWGADFSVFWAAGRVSLENGPLYDAEYLTIFQSLVVDKGLRPFVYPPTALLIFTPLGLLPFSIAYGIWTAASVLCFLAACRVLVPLWASGLAVVAPPVVFALVVGQTSLLLAAAAIWGMSLVRSRPYLGGVVLGLAAAVKPQLFVVAPVLLWGDRKALAGFGAGGSALVLTSLALGPSRWLEWGTSLPRFADILADANLRGMSPLGTAAWLGFEGDAATVLQVLGVVAGLALAGWARPGDAITRVFGLTAGSVLCSPYTVIYDVAGLAPIAAISLFRGRLAGVLTALPMALLGAAVTFPAAVIAFMADHRHRDQDEESDRSVA